MVNMHLMKEFILNKDTYQETEWARSCEGHRRYSVIICWMDGCEFVHSALGITGLGKTVPFCHQISPPGPKCFHNQWLVGRPSSTIETIIAREVLQVWDVKWSILGHQTDVKELGGNQTLFTCQGVP